MRHILYRKYSLWLIVIVQALCLLIGLLLQYRFVISAASWKVEKKLQSTAAAVQTADRQTADEHAADQHSTDSHSTGGSSADEHDKDEPALTAPALLDALPLGGFLAFVWIGGTQVLAFYFLYSRAHDYSLQQQIHSLERTLRQEKDLIRTRNAVIFGLAKLAESRDTETGHHLERIALYCTRLAEELRRHPHFQDRIDDCFMALIGISSALHDIGKVGVEDAILKKPGPLTADERRRIEQHTRLGANCIHEIEIRLGSSNFLQMARDIALYHHERWDGAGYPTGLQGDQIPLAARIVAVADVYDALSSKRVYKEAFPHEECVDIIRREAGLHFDPEIVEVFLRVADRFRDVAQSCSDPDERRSRTKSPPKPRARRNVLEDELLQTVFSLADAVNPDDVPQTFMN